MVDPQNFPFDITRILNKIGNSTRIVVLGGMDTGKTTLIRTLQDEIGGLVIDGDLGQSEIGPPGLISLGTYDSGIQNGYFVGSFTPRGNLVQVITGIAKLVNSVSERCFIDTDGWVEGEAARIYKGELISLVDPDVLLLLQKEDELKKFATYPSDGSAITLEAQKREAKSRGERTANRIRKFKYHFSRASRVKKTWEELKIAGTLLGQGEKVPSAQLEETLKGEVTAGWRHNNTLSILSSTPPDCRSGLKEKFNVGRIEHHPTTELKYRLVGCYKNSNFAGEATITGIGREEMEILTPEKDFNIVKLGKERVKPSGRTIK